MTEIKSVSMPYDMSRCWQYLIDRGFPKDPKLLDEAGIEFAGSKKCYNALNKPPNQDDDRLGIIFNYPETDYATVRWMGTYTNAFGVVKGKDRKLECPKENKVPCYIPATIDWTRFSGTLYICESALKALVLSTRGYAAIGGNGTFGIYNKNGWAYNFPHEIVRECERVCIVFDNDYKRNPLVRLAIRRLGNAIKEQHPDVEVLHKPIPDPEIGTHWHDVSRGKHAGTWGIDDFIAFKGDEALTEWVSDDNEKEIESTELQKHFDELNEQYTVCRYPGCIIDQNTGTMYKHGEFAGLIEAPRIVFTEGDKPKPMPVAKLWIQSPERTMVENVVYKPGSPRLVDESYNQWLDDGVESREGDISPFLKVYENAIPSDLERKLLFQSMAFMLQNRGVKLDKTFLFIGAQMGTGKSLLVQTLGKCVGRRNFSSIGTEDFTSDFNSSFVAKEVILLDDMYRLPRNAMAKLQRYVTDKTIMVNPKGIQQYEVDNRAVYFMTSNEFMVLPMSGNDRRVLTVSFDPTKHYPQGDKWWTEYLDWLDHGGYGIVRHWLETLDLSDFNPNYMPPMTATKQKVIDASKGEDELWARDLRQDPDLILGKNKRTCYTPKELWMLYTGSGEEPSQADLRKFGTALTNAGFDQANGGKVCKVEGKVSRYWICRGRDEWTSKAVIQDVKANKVITL